MIDNPPHILEEEKVSFIPIKIYTCIGRSFISDSTTQEIKSFLENNKNLYDSKYASEHLDSDLHLTERSEWNLHENKNFPSHYLKEIESNIIDVMKKIDVYPVMLEPGGCDSCDIRMTSMWYAKCKDGAFTDPHNHGTGISNYSFVYYLNIPSKVTSIAFSIGTMQWKKRIMIREGDLIVFKSDLNHWVFETEANRSLIAGNFIKIPTQDALFI